MNHKKYYRENRERMRQNQANYWRRRSDAVYCILGNVCKKCGFSDRRALQIDHIDGGGKLERKKFSVGYMYIRILRMRHPEKKYQILCSNCNWIKRVENNEVGGARGREI